MSPRLALMGAPMAIMALQGCAVVNDASYGLDIGDANYDALKAATEKCQAQGGVVRLRPGYDARVLSNYDCVIGKAR